MSEGLLNLVLGLSIFFSFCLAVTEDFRHFSFVYCNNRSCSYTFKFNFYPKNN